MNNRLHHLLLVTTLLVCSLVASLVVNPVSAQESQPEARITQVDVSQFPRVTLYVSVTDETGKPRTINPNTIRIYENDVLMEPLEISGSGELGPLSAMLVMDVSGSMNEAGKLEAAKEAALAFVDNLKPGDQAGVMAFNTQVDYTQPLTDNLDLVRTAIGDLTADKDTAFYDALIKAEDALSSVSGRKAIVVLTDGLDNISRSTTQDVLNGISEGGLSISTIGLGEPDKKGINSGLDELSLMQLADQAGGLYAYANDADTLKRIYENYGLLLQSEYRISYTTPSKLRDGIRRSLRVEVGAAGGAPGETSSEYNPGGVLPEVETGNAWRLFGILLAALGVLLVIPVLVRLFPGRSEGKAKGTSQKKPSKSAGHIKLKEPPKITLK